MMRDLNTSSLTREDWEKLNREILRDVIIFIFIIITLGALFSYLGTF